MSGYSPNGKTGRNDVNYSNVLKVVSVFVILSIPSLTFSILAIGIKFGLFIYTTIISLLGLLLIRFLRLHIYVLFVLLYFLGGTGFHLGSILPNSVFLIQYPLPIALFLLLINLYLARKWCLPFRVNLAMYVFILFIIWAFLTLTYSPNKNYGLYKFLHLVFDTTVAYTTYVILRNSKNASLLIFKYMETFLLFLYIGVLADLLTFPGDLNILGFDKNTYAREVLFLTLILNKKKYYLLSLPMLFYIGSRLAFLVFLIVFLLKFLKSHLKIISFIWTVAVMSIYFLKDSLFNKLSTAKYLYLVLKLAGNISILKEAIHQPAIMKSFGLYHRFLYFIEFNIPTDVKKAIFGYGLGGFNIYWFSITGFLEKNIYPHSLPIEILIETGIVGFVVFSLFLLYLCKLSRHSRLLFLSLVLIFAFTATLEQFKFFLFVIIIISLKETTVLSFKNPINHPILERSGYRT